MDERIAHIQRILDCTGSLFHNLSPARERAWQSTELTMPQLKALMCVVRNNGATSGQIAKALGVGLSTVTGIVDRLAEQDFVTRGEDPTDRRITRVLATGSGVALVNELVRYRDEAITEILLRLSPQQLDVVETALRYVDEAVRQTIEARQAQEVAS